jgi:crotonobetainyl-CoA:carnitine CoA-transferase CaiB-like acyl-CoA transferase
MKLQGLRVVDFSPSVPGSVVARLMADHGAQVVKIESPTGALLHRQGPMEAFAERGKQRGVLDLKQPEQRAQAWSWIADADVLVESNRPGVMARLGLGYEAVAARHPRLVYASISAFGQNGPLRDTPAHDLSIRAMAGGLMADDGPVVPRTIDASLAGAYLALAGVMMAVHAARTSGRGDWLDLSLHDVALTLQAPGLPERAGGPAAEPARSAFHDLYRTADGGWICIAGREPAFVDQLLRGLGLDALHDAAANPDASCQAEVRQALASRFEQRSRAEWIDWFAGRSIAFAPVLDYAEALAHPQVAARGMCLVDARGHQQLNTPLRFLREPAEPRLEVPGPQPSGQAG